MKRAGPDPATDRRHPFASARRRAVEHGVGDPEPQGRSVHFGEFTAVLLGSELRYVRLGDREVLRRVHLAVRDVGWGTVLPDVRSIDVRQGGDDLAVSSDLGHTAGRVVVDCAVEITGSDQRLAYAMDGVFGADFDYNRIGLCVLLPPVEYAGASFAASGPDGSINGILPVLIGPQRIDGDLILPLFPAFDRLRVQIAPDLAVELDFSGDLFEMEDQRNWTDDSFKIYSTPLAQPRPRHARSGEPLRQTFSMRVTRPLS